MLEFVAVIPQPLCCALTSGLCNVPQSVFLWSSLAFTSTFLLRRIVIKLHQYSGPFTLVFGSRRGLAGSLLTFTSIFGSLSEKCNEFTVGEACHRSVCGLNMPASAAGSFVSYD